MPDRSSGWRECLGKGHGGQPPLKQGGPGFSSSWDIPPSSDSHWGGDELSGSHEEKVWAQRNLGLARGRMKQKSNVFIWTSGCLTTLYLQMHWGLLTALKVQLDCETWLETRHFSSESPCVESRSGRRAAPILRVVQALVSGGKVPLFSLGTLNKSLRLIEG